MKEELQRCALSRILLRAYGAVRLRRAAMALALRLEGGEFYSATAREMLARYHGVRVGAYSYGPCMTPGALPAGVLVGRYVSMAAGVKVFRRNHPVERLALHPFFFNHALGVVPQDTVHEAPLTIGHDAWIGYGALLLPGCTSIGIGAVVGAGAVVTRNVPNFAVVAGNPARLLRYRFAPETCVRILESRWWECSREQCVAHLQDFLVPMEETMLWRHPSRAEASLTR